MNSRTALFVWGALVGAGAVACSSTPAYHDVPSLEGRLRVRVIVADPVVERACTDALARALRGPVERAGGPLDVEVVFWIEEGGSVVGPVRAIADLTATWRGSRPRRRVIASGLGTSTRALAEVSTGDTRARYAACEDGAAHLAVALAEPTAAP